MPKPTTQHLPVLPLRGLMVFPYMVLHFDVGRRRSLAALERALADDQRVFLVAQHDAGEDAPASEDLYTIGTIAHVQQVLKLPGDTVRVLVEGVQRGRIVHMEDEKSCLMADIAPVKDITKASPVELTALVNTAHKIFESFAQHSPRISHETAASVLAVDDATRLADILAANVLTRMDDRQRILESSDVGERLETLCGILARDTELSQVEEHVQQRVRTQMEKNQKDYFLREQIRAIQSELGDKESNDIDDLKQKASKMELNAEAREKVDRELTRLSRLSNGSPEAGVSRTYVEWILALPWGKSTPDKLDLARAKRVLDSDHDGLEKVKERILEYIAVAKMKGTFRGPILCLVGPPGVGKTSVARSIARALGRKFAQMSLGGLRDEAEIRGHRRTYIGAVPGRILYGVRQAGTMNPLFLLDEIDKMQSDFHGDPASALLEVLDPEQNASFRDHYLELPFDLSQVLFVTTANSEETIPAALLDRMEVIRLSGYTPEEKVSIAKHHLTPKQQKAHGVLKTQVKLPDRTVKALITGYTREAGVRALEQQIASLLRKAVVQIVDDPTMEIVYQPAQLEDVLGPARFRPSALEHLPEVGVAQGMAYTAYGGTTLAVEASVMPGNGVLELTGQLGNVMKESAQAARSFLRTHAASWGLPTDFHKTCDIHLHVPEGAVPKDGPSAGVTICCAMLSALTGVPLKQNIAMTGEITLRGRVLPVGGIKEKLLSAHRHGIREILLPRENKADLHDLPVPIREQLKITLLDTVEDALVQVMTQKPLPRTQLPIAAGTNPLEIHDGH